MRDVFLGIVLSTVWRDIFLSNFSVMEFVEILLSLRLVAIGKIMPMVSGCPVSLAVGLKLPKFVPRRVPLAKILKPSLLTGEFGHVDMRLVLLCSQLFTLQRLESVCGFDTQVHVIIGYQIVAGVLTDELFHRVRVQSPARID